MVKRVRKMETKYNELVEMYERDMGMLKQKNQQIEAQ